MDISFELNRLVEYATNQAIDSVINSDGPLLSFMCIDGIDGTFGKKDFPQGTTDDDIIAIASLPGVQRYALLTSGKMESESGQIPALLVAAAERGDPTGILLVQKFMAGQSPVFSQPDGHISPAQIQENFFKHAPPHQMGDDDQGSLLMNEAFKRFATRLMKRAFREPEPRISSITVMIAGGKIDGEASFFYVHGETGAMVKVTFTETDNVFVLHQVSKLDDKGVFSDLEAELLNPILNAYQASPLQP